MLLKKGIILAIDLVMYLLFLLLMGAHLFPASVA